MSAEEKKDLILNVLAEILATIKNPGNNIHDVVEKIAEMAEGIGENYTTLYKRAKEIETKNNFI